MKPIARLRLTQEHRDKISAAMRGRTMSPEEREKRSRALKGRRHAPERVEKITAERRARGKQTAEKVLEGCREAVKERLERVRVTLREQYNRDLAAAYHSGDLELFADVRLSSGWSHKRRKHDPSGQVSSGVNYQGHVVWPRKVAGVEEWMVESYTLDPEADRG